MPTITLRALDTTVAYARHAAALMLAGLVPPSHLHDVKLVVSEMVTNAIRVARAYARSREFAWTHLDTPVHLSITCGALWTRVDVRDPDRVVPVPSMADPLSESGRGLLIVGAIAADVWPTVHADGKVLHAVIAMPGATLTAAELLEARQ